MANTERALLAVISPVGALFVVSGMCCSTVVANAAGVSFASQHLGMGSPIQKGMLCARSNQQNDARLLSVELAWKGSFLSVKAKYFI